ncbi:MAG: hypothetical protein QG656_2464 [Candidatus Hydrogenedentes bacterium]|nr:hypothetical protein [Candidatus Hydrogenedentota bacterium]
MRNPLFLRGVSSRSVRLTLAAVLFLGLTAFVTPDALAGKIAHVTSIGVLSVHDDSEPGPMKSGEVPDDVLKANTIVFNVTYLDPANVGFNDPAYPDRKNRLLDALQYVGDAIGETGTLDLRVSASTWAGTSSYLAYGGTYYAFDAGFSNGNAYQRLKTGTKPSPSYPELTLTVNWSHNYYLGTGAPGGSQADLLSVLIHEFTHGIGISSLSESNGGTAVDGTYTVFDNFLVTGYNDDLFADISGTVMYVGLPGDLTGDSGGVKFTGPNATAAFGSNPPIYCPSTWQSGSSIAHWNQGGIPGGAVMEPIIVSGTTKRVYHPMEIGALKDLGYSMAALPSPVQFIVQPTGGWYEEGPTHTFNVMVTGTTGTVTYQWVKDGVNIPGATGTEYTLNSLVIQDTGHYWCAINDETKALYESDHVYLGVFPVGSLPVGGLTGLGIAIGLCLLTGARTLRRKR